MSRLDEVFEALHDLILERFRVERGGEVGNAFVAFEFGTPIPDDTFRLRDQNQTLSPEMAVEFLSQHANTVPEVKDMLFRRRAYTVEAQYGLMLGGATPVEASSMEMLGTVKREAMTKYDQTLGSLIGPYRYRPVYATPVNWYDETESGNWTHISIDRADTPPSRPEGKTKLSPELRMWRIAPQALRPALDLPVSTTTFRQMEVVPPLRPRELSKRPRARFTRLTAAQSATVQQPAAQPPAGTIALESVAHNRARDFATLVAGAQVEQPAPASAVITIDSLLAVDASWTLAKVIETNAKQQDVVTDQIKISVDICLVNLHRPWLSDALLSLPGWFVPGFDKGEFSDAHDEEDGPFAVLPTACILIRNLQIKAQWSDEDNVAMEQSANLGSFNLFGRSFDRNTATLTVPGMQSIAWVCEPMPLLPPADAP